VARRLVIGWSVLSLACACTSGPTNAPAAGDPSPPAGDELYGDSVVGDPYAPADPASPGDPTLPGDDAGGGDPATCAPTAGLGVVTCSCNALGDDEWLSASPFLFLAAIDFGTAGFVVGSLTPGGAEVIADGNLGGSSLESEATAVEVLTRCEQAALLNTEDELHYTNENGKKTDERMEIDGRLVGVSVVRAYHYPPENPYSEAEALVMLSGKLDDLPVSQGNALPEFAWSRSLLFVIAYNQQYADAVLAVWQTLTDDVRRDAILFVTTTNGDDSALY